MTKKTLRLFASILPLLGMCLACLAPVEGDRSATGECPAGERCSSRTPEGLTFVGQAFFDAEGVPRLGPVVAGGRLEVGLENPGSESMPLFVTTTSDAAVLDTAANDALFGPATDDGTPLYSVERWLTLRAGGAGEAYLRVLDPSSGELYDRTSIVVVDVRDVRLENVTDGAARDHLLAGCSSMVGVRLLAEQDGVEIRAIDDGMRVWADGAEITPEPRLWDCVQVDAGASATAVEFEVLVGGRRYVRSLPVHTLRAEGLTACPVRRAD
jgi:hypothetical protein